MKKNITDQKLANTLAEAAIKLRLAKKLAEAIIELRLANNDLPGAIVAASTIYHRQLEYNEWHVAYENLGAKKIAETLAVLENKEANIRFLAYLETGKNIEELVLSANMLSLTLKTDKLGGMVQRLIKNEVPEAEGQIISAAEYISQSSPTISKNWLQAARKIALENGNIAIMIKLCRIGRAYKLSEQEIEHLLLIHINRMTEETKKEKKEKSDHALQECKNCIQLIKMLPPEKQIYRQLIFGH